MQPPKLTVHIVRPRESGARLGDAELQSALQVIIARNKSLISYIEKL